MLTEAQLEEARDKYESLGYTIGDLASWFSAAESDIAFLLLEPGWEERGKAARRYESEYRRALRHVDRKEAAEKVVVGGLPMRFKDAAALLELDGDALRDLLDRGVPRHQGTMICWDREGWRERRAEAREAYRPLVEDCSPVE